MTDAEPYDAIIIGSGAGGSAAAYRLVRAGARVALIEKGGELPRDGSTLDFARVVHEGKFKSREQWQDARGRRFSPEEYFNVGGKTKWYGAALLRYHRREFNAEAQYPCAAWPIDYDELSPFYDEAERLLGVREFDCEPGLERLAARLQRRSPDWRIDPLPMGLSAGILNNPLEARHFDGFASVADLKSEAETAFLGPIRSMPNFELMTSRPVAALIGSAADAAHIVAVRLEDGTVLRARAVLLAAGALHSPRLLQNYFNATGLAHSLPCAAHVGRNLKYHLLTAVIAVSTSRVHDTLRKTRIFSNLNVPHSSVQPLGFDGELISTLIPKLVPRAIARLVGERAYGFFLQTEDGAHPDNRVISGSLTAKGVPLIDYDAARTPAAAREHRQLVRSFNAALARAGMIALSRRIGLAGTAHVSGTLIAGRDGANSVVDSLGKVHGMRALYVVDGSILPRSSRVNPSLTIYAWGLRTAATLATRFAAERG